MMTTIEKLWVQIFERKAWIVDQVEQQTRLFDQHLASKLLIEGIAPPPWLLNPDLRSRSELNAEDLISGVLLSRPRPAIPFSFSHCAVYEEPVAEATNGELPNGLSTEACAQNDDVDAGDETSSLPQNHVNDAGFALVGVSALDHCIASLEGQRDEDPSITSPQDQRDTGISDVNHELALSLARLQRSRSRQKALELRSSAKVAKCRFDKDDSQCGYSGGTKVSAVPFQGDQLEELTFSNPLDTNNEILAVEDVTIGGTWSKEKGSRTDSGRIMRSKSSARQQSNLNVASSCHVAREDDAMLADSIGPSIQQSHHKDRPLVLVSELQIGNQSRGTTEAKVGEKRSKEIGSSNDSRRITRSRTSTQQTNSASELLKADGSYENHKESGISNLMPQAKLVDIKEESIGLETELGRLNEHVAVRYSGRITRSRSSHQSYNPVRDFSKPVGLSPVQKKLELSAAIGKERSANEKSAEGYIFRSNVSLAATTIRSVPEAVHSSVNDPISTEPLFAASNGSHSRECTQVPAERSLLSQQNEELCAANSTDSSDKEEVVDEYVCRNTRTEPAFTVEVTSKLESSQDLGRRVTRSISAASHKALETKSLNRLESNGCEKVPNIDVEDRPCTSTSEPANQKGSASTFKETKRNLAGPVKAHSADLGSNLNGAGAAELEVLATYPANSSMPVEPRQLNFDDVEVSSFNGIQVVSCRKETAGGLLGKSASALSESASILANGMSENFTENHSLPLTEKDDLSTEEEPRIDFSEAHVEDTDTAVMPPAKAISCAEKAIVTHVFQQSDKSAKEKFLTGDLVKSLPGSALKEDSSSNLSDVNACTGMNLSSATETGTRDDAVPAELVPEDSRTHISHFMDCELSKDADFLLVTRLAPFGNQEACIDQGLELPHAVSKDESRESLAHETVDLDIYQHLTAEPQERSTRDDTNVEGSQSTQSRIAAESKGKSSFCSSVEGSLTQNKRKRIDPVNNLYTSPGMKEDAVLHFDKDSESRVLLSEESSPKDFLNSQDLQVSQGEVAQLVISASQVAERHQMAEHNVRDRSESSSKLLCEEADFSMEERNRSANMPYTFTNEELEASVAPGSGFRQATGDFKGPLMEEARETDPTSIICDGEWQHILEANRNSSYLENGFGIVNTGSMIGTENIMQDKKSDLPGAAQSTYGSRDSPHSHPLFLAGADDTMPVLEGFILQSDDEQLCSVDEEITFDDLNLPKTAIERAGILEQLCKSACMQTPVSCSSTTYKLHNVSNLYQSVPTGLLEGLDMKNKHLINEEFTRAFQGRPHSDSFQSSTVGRDWDIKKPCLSPVRKVWDKIISKSGSSEKRRSLNPDLPCINEESENIEEVADTYQEGIVSDMTASSIKRKPLAGIDENLPVSEAEPYADRFSIDSVNTEFSCNGTHNRAKNNLENGKSVKRRYNNKENESLSLGEAACNGKMASLQNRFSKQKSSARTSSRNRVTSFTAMEPKRNNIVSNITSFIPLVQQKQAAAIPTGKRDVKVKALEAAEAAKRLAEKKENERKIKKEAMKLERARLEQENLRQLELQKKRKEKERKKKEADMAAKKRQREEEEKKEKERKRMRVEETRKQQRENEQKLQAAKEEKDKFRTMNERGHEMKESKDGKKNNNKMGKAEEDDNIQRILETDPTTSRASASDDRTAGIVHEDYEASSDLGNNLKVNNKPTRTESLVASLSQEPSYDISPYKCSDDEDEDEDDDRPNGKFVPSWASKNAIASAISSQDGDSLRAVFHPKSFCSIDEDLLGRFLGELLGQ